jgi:hypothetical protein
VIADPNAMSACSQLLIDLPYRPPLLNVVRGHPTGRRDRHSRWANGSPDTGSQRIPVPCLLMMNSAVQEQGFPDRGNRFT